MQVICQIFFSINRGVRQGCPLSPYLFIICIEILSLTLQNDHDVTGIKINGKSTMFADDATFAMDGSLKSFKTLISILDDFRLILGFKTKWKLNHYFKNRFIEVY